MLLIGLVTHILTLLLSQKLLATAQPDTSLDSSLIFNLFEAGLGPTPESSQLVRYVRNAAEDYEENGEQRDQDHIKPGRKKKKKFVEREKQEAKRGTRNGRGGELENSPQASIFCFKVCNSLIFEVYQLLGGNVCNCDK